MKKKILNFALSTLGIFGCFAVTAQQLDIEWGKPFDSSTEIYDILGFSNKKMVAYSAKGKKNYIETYNESGLDLISSNEYEVPEIGSKTTGLLSITIQEDQILAIVYGYDKKTKSITLYEQNLTLEGKQIGKVNEIYASDASDDKISFKSVDSKYSSDRSKLLVYFDRADKQRVLFYSDVIVIDLKDKDAEPMTLKESFKMRDSKADDVLFKMYHSVDNDGNSFFMQERQEFAKRKITNFALDIEGFDLKGESFGNVSLTEPGKILLNPCIVSGRTGITVVGYYMSNPEKFYEATGYAGIFRADLEKDLSVSNFKTSKFSDNFFLDLYSANKIERLNKKGTEIRVPKPYSINDIIVHADGTLTVLSEFFQVTVIEQNGQRSTQTHYGPIIMLKIDKDGLITADDVIKKNQASTTTSVGIGGAFNGLSFIASYEIKDKRKKYWSYALSTIGNEVFLVFNDHVKNAEDDEDDVSKALINPSKGLPYLVTITEDGTFTKKIMGGANDTETYCVPQVIYPTGEGAFIIWGVRSKQNKFGRASIK